MLLEVSIILLNELFMVFIVPASPTIITYDSDMFIVKAIYVMIFTDMHIVRFHYLTDILLTMQQLK
jgi:hypothetical protein